MQQYNIGAEFFFDVRTNFEDVSVNSLQKAFASNTDDVDSYRDKLEKQLGQYVGVWEQAKATAAGNASGLGQRGVPKRVGRALMKGNNEERPIEDDDRLPAHFLWPQPMLDNATTGTELMTQ